MGIRVRSYQSPGTSKGSIKELKEVQEDKKMKKEKIHSPFSMHVEIDFEGTTESDGDIYTITQDVVFDQLKYVFERLQQKGIKVSFRMEMSPATKTTYRRAQG
jgi:hypothetical protein